MSRRQSVGIPNAAELDFVIRVDLGSEPPAAPAVALDAPTADLAPVQRVPADSTAYSVAILEVLGFPARLLADLPESSTLVCANADDPTNATAVIITTARSVYERTHGSTPTYSGRELAAMTLAAEHDRANPAALAEWSLAKLADRSWSLSPAAAIGGAVDGPFAPRGWSVGQVLRRYGLELVGVGVGDELPTGGST
jgi:hypothetical protein